MADKRLVVCVNERYGGQKSCAGAGSRELIKLLQQRLAETGADIPLVEQVCLGRCEEGIAMRIAPGGAFFTEVSANDIDAIVSALLAFEPAAKA
ncbi:MAG: (2Fe-2S) ferredoxin domain-containing protein [Gammaproteobacteria bacterium]|nr:(2Fe-2S) ferredoxin domain-containing protein [Gammaproteobacteria bacterium]